MHVDLLPAQPPMCAAPCRYRPLVRRSDDEAERGHRSASFVGRFIRVDIVIHVRDEGLIELIGVYDADSTVVGEISYWIGARLGRRHCSLCDLTHGLVSERSEWKRCVRTLSVPFRTFHRNDAPADVLAAAAGSFPVVLARSAGLLEVILDPGHLDAFAGSTEQFAEWLRARYGP